MDGDDEGSSAAKKELVITATNTRWAAFGTKHSLSVRTLEQDNGESYHSEPDDGGLRQKPVFAFSALKLSSLAVSWGVQTRIHNVENRSRCQVIPGTGRTVICIAWSYHDPDVLATGTIDGNVQVWSLKRAFRPLHRLLHSRAQCDVIAWSPIDKDILASAHENKVIVWALQRHSRPVKTLSVTHASIIGLEWHPSVPGRLLSSYTDGVVRVWDVPETISSPKPTIGDVDDESEDDEIFGELEGLRRVTHPIAQVQLDKSPRVARWIGEHGTVVLLEDGREVLFYSYGHDWTMPHQVWQLTMSTWADTVVVRDGSTTTLNAISNDHDESHRIPSTVLDSLGGHAEPAPATHSTAVLNFATNFDDGRESLSGQPRDVPPGGVLPVSIAQVRTEKGSFAKTSKQLQQRRRTDSQKSKETVTTMTELPPQLPMTSPSQPMISSLELPKPRAEDIESPMPFLSPTIPSRKPSPNTLPPVDDIIHLPPLQHGSFDSMPSTAAHDSDSDDETFADGMVGSARFLPGGINVPLPKACGALFAPNGQLLTFFPPKPRPSTERRVDGEQTPQTRQRIKASRIARLFPTFGNMVSDSSASDDDSRTESSASSVAGLAEDVPALAIQSSPLSSQAMWGPRSSPEKATYTPATDEHKVVVSVHDIDTILPSRRAIAAGYHVLLEGNKSGSDLCQHNARVADEAGLSDAAGAWRLIAMILEDKVPLQTLSCGEDEEDVLIIARRATSLLRNDSGVDLTQSDDEGPLGKLRWGQHPLAADWLVRKTMEWAEQRADVQMLANLSAVLAEAMETVPRKHATARQSMLAKLATHGPDYAATQENRDLLGIRNDRPVPVLRTDSSLAPTIYDYPNKLRHFSQASSRNPSVPTTPRLESLSSTPPLPWQALSRQSTKLSASGSGAASPEHHRGSFNAAAKYYAQSITDKFASYGTSPPVKKLGTSPVTNELSTSLPAAAPNGSWSKTVSFASMASTTRDSQFGRNLTPNEDGYDSDKTIDESSVPHTPKNTNAPVLPKLLNQDAFSDEVSGNARMPLLRPDLAAKAVIWREYYAEQLRCSGLWMQATELEKVSGLTTQRSATPASVHDGVSPVRAPGQRKATCSICFTTITRIEQLCPACLHATHLACMEDYFAGLGSEAYECPAGCGCACAEMPLEPVELSIPEAEASTVSGSLESTKRKGSLTDPRKWRVRFEGALW